jgi:multidrug efflux pump subunit AcrA (membrane-fusion protein)
VVQTVEYVQNAQLEFYQHQLEQAEQEAQALRATPATMGAELAAARQSAEQYRAEAQAGRENDWEAAEVWLQAIASRGKVCAHDGIRCANLDEDGYTPFRCTPSASSRSGKQRCIHAMFLAWREVGCVAMNPMGFHGAGTQRKVNVNRSVTLDLYDPVLETMEGAR